MATDLKNLKHQLKRLAAIEGAISVYGDTAKEENPDLFLDITVIQGLLAQAVKKSEQLKEKLPSDPAPPTITWMTNEPEVNTNVFTYTADNTYTINAGNTIEIPYNTQYVVGAADTFPPVPPHPGTPGAEN